MSSSSSRSGNVSVGCFFAAPGIAVAESWGVTLKYLAEAGVTAKKYCWQAFQGSRQKERNEPEVLSGEDIYEFMQIDDAAGFTITSAAPEEGQSFQVWPASPLSPWQHYIAKAKQLQQSVSALRPLTEDLTRLAPLAVAVIVDEEYRVWQQCTDPDFYARRYGSTTGYPVIRIAGEPPLPDLLRLDTTRNPGRRDEVNGGPAMVAAEMWLGPAFWTYAPCRKEEVLSQSWLNPRATEHFLHIKAYPEPFTRPDGEQGEIQRRLWELLFHSSCSWPPKSA